MLKSETGVDPRTVCLFLTERGHTHPVLTVRVQSRARVFQSVRK